jgi:outer membrane protein OmpA-like peptidoglycan-associated protein
MTTGILHKAGLAVGVLLISAPAALADCLALDKELRVIVSRGDLESFEGLYRRMVVEPTCDGRYRQLAGRLMARAYFRALIKRLGSLQGAVGELEKAASFGQPWQLMQTLGDIYYARKNFVRAVRAYETALDDIRDVNANPKPPPEAVEKRLAKLAYQARALAPQYVATRRFRGRPSGLASPKFRNFTAVAVPVPVKFTFGESVLTPDGEKAAKDIYAYLDDQGSPDVRLIGHTDPVGAPYSNQVLSVNRAKAVADYLLAQGYKGRIEVVGKGETQRFKPDDPTKYTRDELHTFDRRVEYQLLAKK